MRWPRRNELFWISYWVGLTLALAVFLFVFHLIRDTLSYALAISGIAVFFGAYVFAVTRTFSRLGARVALVFFVFGFVSFALLPPVDLNLSVGSVAAWSMVAVGVFGFSYISFIEIPVTMPKKSGARGRMLDVGFLLMIVGLSIPFVAIPSINGSYFLPVILAGRVSLITGTVLFSLAVLRARKRFVSAD